MMLYTNKPLNVKIYVPLYSGRLGGTYIETTFPIPPISFGFEHMTKRQLKAYYRKREKKSNKTLKKLYLEKCLVCGHKVEKVPKYWNKRFEKANYCTKCNFEQRRLK